MKDELKLFETMIQDFQNVKEIYRPTNYWNKYIDEIISVIKEDDLENIRSKNSIFNAFGGSDIQGDYFSLQKDKKIIPLSILRHFSKVTSSITKKNFQELAYYQAFYYDKLYGINKLNEVSISNVWNPKDVFEMDGKHYSIAFLKYYLQYVYMSRFIDFDNVSIYIDLGTGMSKVTEIIHKLYPNVTILLFDMFPVLYVVDRYMKSVFPKETIGYESTRDFSTLSNIKKGLIYVLPNWKFPLIDTLSRIDVFINSASFQEMELPVVNNYLSFVNQKASYIYLREDMNGKEKARYPGDIGNIEPVTFKDYYNCLKEYKIIDRSRSVFPLITKPYEDILFKRR